MPLRDFVCWTCKSEPEEHYYKVVDGEMLPLYCDECGASLAMAPLSAGQVRGKTAIFPYTTKHISGDGKPVTVESLGHLRRLERKYGVNVSGFSQEPGNPDSPSDLPVGRPNGREYEGPRVPWLG